MNEENPVAQEEGTAVQLSVGEAISGALTEPSDTFETIASTPRRNYWLMPVLITVALSLVSTFLFMGDAELVQSVMEKQKSKLEADFDKNVKEGKMTREEADKALDGISPESSFFKIAGFGGAVIGPFLILFILSVIYMVVLKISKADFDFGNVLNVVGLAMVVGAIGNVLGMVISILMGRVTGVGLGILFSEDSVGAQMFSLLSKIDIFQIWFYLLDAIGLSKIARISIAKSAGIVFGIFIVYAVAFSFI